MHNASETSSADEGGNMTSMDTQLAKVVAHLAKTDPAALPAVLKALGATGPTQLTSAAITPSFGVTPPTIPNAPDGLEHQTPTPLASATSFYTEGTLRQPNNVVRAETASSFGLQSASNIRAGWAASKAGRKSIGGRVATNKTSAELSKGPEHAPAVTKPFQAPLAKDHAVQLKNQPIGGVIYVPASEIFAENTPWTDEKVEILRRVCRKRQFIGYPVFSYGMTIDDVRDEVTKALPAAMALDIVDYHWIGSEDDGTCLYHGPRAKSTAARNLDRFFEDGGLGIITPVNPVYTGEEELESFLQDWRDAVHGYEVAQARKSNDRALKDRVLGFGQPKMNTRTAEVSPANARDSLRLLVAPRRRTLGAQDRLSLVPVAEEAAATDFQATGTGLGGPIVLSDTSSEATMSAQSQTVTGGLTLVSDAQSSQRESGAAGTAPDNALDLISPSTKGKRTPKTKRPRIEWSPLFAPHQETVPRVTRNSARAGTLDNAASTTM